MSMSIGSWLPTGTFVGVGLLAVLAGCHDKDKDDYRAKHDHDCNDEDAAIHPGVDEICDGIDNNCNGAIDDSPVDASTWYVDVDGDAFGNAKQSYSACNAPPGWVADATDCNDFDATAFPGGTEICDGVDNDCSGKADEGKTSVFYADVDGDSFGDVDALWEGCEAPPGWVTDDTDCDDLDAEAFPANIEVCDGVDNNCDAAIDEDTMLTFYADVDGDDFGDENATWDGCEAPPGWVADKTDCNDFNATAFPANPEVCDAVDNNCDGAVDEGAAKAFHPDDDGDSFGNSKTTFTGCIAPAGWVVNATDCDDASSVNFPGNVEVCDTLDNDCNGVADNGVLGKFYTDADGDQYGNASAWLVSCFAPPGFVADNTDCNDGDFFTWPGALDLCDGVDGDCDGIIDNSGFDSDGDNLDNCNDPTVYTENFNVAVGPSGSWGPFGWTVAQFADIVPNGNAATGNLAFPVAGTPTTPQAWTWGATVLDSGAGALGHSMALSPDHGELNVYTIFATLAVPPTGVNALGLVFNYNGPGDYYMVRYDDPTNSFAPRTTKVELIRCIAAQCAVMDTLDPAPLFGGAPLSVEIRVRYDAIDVYTGGVLRVNTITNGGDIGPGRIGAYAFAGANAVRVDSLAITQP